MRIPVPISRRRSTSAVDRPRPTFGGKYRNSCLRAVVMLAIVAACTMDIANAEIPPPPDPFKVTEHRSGSTWTQVILEDGHIGEVDLDEIRDGDLTSVVELLQDHSDWTEAGDDLELVLVSMHGRTMSFRQQANGVRVTSACSIRSDEHGNVVRLRSVLAHPASFRDSPTMTEDEAIEIGKRAWQSYVGSESAVAVVLPRPGSGADVEPPTLYLNLPDDPDGNPEFSWRMEVMWVAGGRSRTVDVNARSGDSQVWADVIIE